MSKIEVDTIDTQSSTTLQVGSTNTALIKIGTSGDTVEYPAGTTFTQSGTQNVTAGGAINVKSGGNITIDSGATITNNGTASGFSADLTNLNATNLTSGTVPDARFPATLPIASGSALTNLNATNLGSGTVPDARFPATLPAISGANLTNLPASGITEADQWRLTTSFTGDATALQNLERVDTSGWGKIGTGMSESAGVFTFPSSGIWFVKFRVNNVYSGANRYATAAIQVTTNNSSYANIASGEQGIISEGNGNVYSNTLVETLIDCTNTSNVKVRFNIDVEEASTTTNGDTNVTYTSMMFIRLGDT